MLVITPAADIDDFRELTLFPRWSRSIWMTAWEQRKLGEVAHRVIRKNESNQSDLPLTISAQHGLVDQRDYFNNQVASRDMSGYYLLENGEFAYNKSTSSDSPWGAIKRLTKYEKGCLSTLYICFGLDQGDPDFLVTYYETNRWHGAVQMIAAEGARNHGLLNIAPDDFLETALTLPCSTEEQKQIGCFFTQLNSLITLHQRKCQYRSLYGYLSWEQRKLNEYLETSREKNESCHFGKDDVLSVSGDYGIVNQIEFQGRSYAGTSVANYGVVHKGDVVYTKSPLRINPYGIIKTNRGNDGIVSTLYAVYHPTEKTHPDFVQVYFEQNARMNNYMAPLVSKGAKNDMKVSAENALKGAVTFPGIKEQEVIASYFSQLDHLITLHQ